MKKKIKTENGVTSLFNENGVPCFCPFRNPVPVPGRLAGSVELSMPQCSSTCPLFVFFEPNKMVRLLCVYNSAAFEVTEIEAAPKLQKL